MIVFNGSWAYDPFQDFLYLITLIVITLVVECLTVGVYAWKQKYKNIDTLLIIVVFANLFTGALGLAFGVLLGVLL